MELDQENTQSVKRLTICKGGEITWQILKILMNCLMQ